MRRRIATCALLGSALGLLALPAFAAALAGGATGGGGGGGGGGGSFGGGSGSSGGQGDWRIGLAVLVLVLLVTFGGGLVGWFKVQKRRRRARRMEREARIADLGDGYWDPTALKARVREAFFPIQESWGKREVDSSRPYVSDALLARHRLQLEGYEAQDRVNRIEDLKLNEVEIVRIYNVTDDSQDRFVAYVACKARDWMENAETGRFVNGNKRSASSFEQFWTFTRHPEHGWVLDEIQQYKEGEYHLQEQPVNLDDGPGTGPVTSSPEPASA